MTVGQHVIGEKVGKSIFRITFDRPKKLNAMTFEMYEQMSAFIAQAEDDDDVKVVILRGAGRAFGAGQDLTKVGFVYGFGTSKDQRRPSIRRRLAIDRRWAAHFRTYWECSKITIAQVQGHCLGAHFTFMLESDFAIAAEDANIGDPGLRLVGPGLEWNLALWMWALGMRRAKDLMFTGRSMSGTEAAALGVVNKAVPADQLEAEVMKLANTLTLIPADGVVLAKEAMRLTFEMMGVNPAYSLGPLSHTINTTMRLEPDEFNFFKERRERGAKAAFHLRDERYDAAGADPSAQPSEP